MTHELRKIAVAWVAALLVVTLAPRAEAHHLSNRWCGESGDICQSVTRGDGERRLTIRTAARYFDEFELCVRDPNGYQVCEQRRLRLRPDGTYARSIAWRDHIWFQRTEGAYVVTWRTLEGTRIGRKLGFHV